MSADRASAADEVGLQHVVLPRRSPGLALLERFLPSPADNVLDAELTAFAAPNDTVLDPWAGTGWTARRAVAHGMRAVAADPSPFAQLAAIAFMTAPGPAALDAAFAQLASARRVDVPLRQHLEELYATRCAACRGPVVAEQFVWPRDGNAGRKVYRCAACDAALGGPPERVAPVDEHDLAKLGLDPEPGADDEPGASDEPVAFSGGGPFEDLPPAPIGLTEVPTDDDDLALGDRGGPPAPPPMAVDPPSAIDARPRYASTVRPEPPPLLARPTGCARARSISTFALGSRSSTTATTSSTRSSSCSRRATSTPCTRSATRSSRSATSRASPPR